MTFDVRQCLRAVWLLAVVWLEIGTFQLALHACRWPDEPETPRPDTRVVRLLVLADPQLIDRHSYPARGVLLSALTQHVVDLNLRKSWNAAFRHLRPHAVVVLGDLMDSGRLAMPTSEYETYVNRYQRIFNMGPLPPPVYYIPGNHDVGLGNLAPFSPEADSRYVTHFGPRNYRRTIANHTLVFIDAPALVEEDLLRAEHGHSFDTWSPISHGPVEFVKQTASSGPSGPVILFTHIPLARPSGAPCGPLREKGSISQGVGFGYQNTLMDGASQFLLESLKPTLIMSGDDHDYCEYKHTIASSDEKVPEVTVKSISMAMGIRRPGLQLLSLTSTVPSPDDITQIPIPPPLHVPCLMPDQLGIYFYIYIPLALLTILALLALNVTRVHGSARYPVRRRKGEAHELDAKSSPTTEVHGSLPPPVGKTREHVRGRSYSSPWTWTFTLGGHRRRIAIANPCGGCKSAPREPGVLAGLVQDVGTVAWPPLCVYLGISCWVMSW